MCTREEDEVSDRPLEWFQHGENLEARVIVSDFDKAFENAAPPLLVSAAHHEECYASDQSQVASQGKIDMEDIDVFGDDLSAPGRAERPNMASSIFAGYAGRHDFSARL